MLNSKNEFITKNFYMILWRDAAYSFEKVMPRHLPPLQLTIGFVYKKTKEYIVVATNIELRSGGKIRPLDGFLIPKAFIVSAERVKVKNIWQKKNRK